MDPQKTLENIYDSWVCHDDESLIEAFNSLFEWFNKEGYTPSVPKKWNTFKMQDFCIHKNGTSMRIFKSKDTGTWWFTYGYNCWKLNN
jgi:hypothetical protein